MPAASLLLIEVVDGVGAHEADAALRARALRRGGAAVRWVVLDPRGAPGPPDGADALSALGTAARREAHVDSTSAVWIAGPRNAAQAIASRLNGIPVTWWPTLLGPTPATARSGPGIIRAGRLDAGRDRFRALEIAVVRPARARDPVSLWDGAFVLAPGPLTGEAARVTLQAFARLAAERHEIDLVVLADPTPEAERATRAIGLWPRVHFAGVAAREAEHTWLATTHALLVADAERLTAGFVLRALAAGVPLVPVGDGAGCRLLREWLGLRLGSAETSADEALELAFQPGVRLERAIAAGRALASAHEPEALAGRLFDDRGSGDLEEREVA